MSAARMAANFRDALSFPGLSAIWVATYFASLPSLARARPPLFAIGGLPQGRNWHPADDLRRSASMIGFLRGSRSAKTMSSVGGPFPLWLERAGATVPPDGV